MFSQLIAGPIVRYAQIADELKGRAHSLALFGLGARRFMVGFCMKVIIADTLSPLVDAIFKLPAPTLADSWLGAVAYTLQLYFDFAGYSAMAIGLALMIGFHFPENFDLPYLAGSIQAFWQRWHITLSSFLRDYLYIPLGGNRKGAGRTYVNLSLTMLIGGFWHGANWTFVAWGAWQGGLLALHRVYNRSGGRMPWLPGHALTLLAVVLGWVVFRADNFGDALRIYTGMAWLHGTGVTDDLAWQLTPDRFWTVVHRHRRGLPAAGPTPHRHRRRAGRAASVAGQPVRAASWWRSCCCTAAPPSRSCTSSSDAGALAFHWPAARLQGAAMIAVLAVGFGLGVATFSSPARSGSWTTR